MKSKSVISFILIMVLIAAFATVCIGDIQIGNFKVPSVLDPDEGIKQGLDLVGGSIIVYEPKGVKNASQTELETAEAVLRERLDDKNLLEATTSIQGETGIRVEIPDMDNPEEALASIGDIAKLEFRYHFTEPNEDGTAHYETAMEGTSEYISSAKMEFGRPNESTPSSVYYVSVEFTSKGREAFSVATTNAYNGSYNGTPIEKVIAITLDDAIVSEPGVNDGPITGGSCVITGNFDAEQANHLASVINSGSLPFALEATELRTVGPTLGAEALKTSLTAALIGIILIMLFMLLFYRLPGLVADISLVAYISLSLLIMAGFFIGDGIESGYRITLTLPGIAGVILSIGMAVDANVVIFERIKDELRQGKSVGAAVEGGYKRAITAVIDSNVTTIIACVVLYFFGSGTIQSFAITLGIGIIVSMFSAVFLTKWLLKLIVNFGVKNNWLYGVNKRRDA